MAVHQLTRGKTRLGALSSPQSTSITASGVSIPVLQWADVSITDTQMKALRATPKQLVAAPGTGYALQFLGAQFFFDYTGAYTESSDDLGVKYTDGSGKQVSDTLDATGFVDATADAHAFVTASQTSLLTANAALVLHNLGDGEYGGGNASNAVKVRCFYRTLPLLS